jgi:hypothetical protein
MVFGSVQNSGSELLVHSAQEAGFEKIPYSPISLKHPSILENLKYGAAKSAV